MGVDTGVGGVMEFVVTGKYQDGKRFWFKWVVVRRTIYRNPFSLCGFAFHNTYVRVS